MVKICPKMGVNRHFQASWASQQHSLLWNDTWFIICQHCCPPQTDIYSTAITTSSPRTVMLRWLPHAYSHPFFCRRVIVTRTVGRTDLVLACDQNSLVGLCMQDYKCLHAVATICATAVWINRQNRLWFVHLRQTYGALKAVYYYYYY